MIKRLFTSIFAFALIFLAASDSMAQRDQSIKVRLGETETSTASGIKVTFLSVVEDSRCPDDAQCVWAGRVLIDVEIEGKNGLTVKKQLSSDGDEKSVVVEDYRVHLTSVSANPEHGSKVGKGPDEGYFAWFRFEKLSGEAKPKKTKDSPGEGIR